MVFVQVRGVRVTATVSIGENMVANELNGLQRVVLNGEMQGAQATFVAKPSEVTGLCALAEDGFLDQVL